MKAIRWWCFVLGVMVLGMGCQSEPDTRAGVTSTGSQSFQAEVRRSTGPVVIPSTGTVVVPSTGTVVIPSTGTIVIPSTGPVVVPSTRPVRRQ